MTNSQYINAYKKTQQSSSSVTSSHEIIKTLMKELINSMKKIALDIQDEGKRKQNQFVVDKAFEEKNARHKSKNVTKSLSIIYGLQTCLDFDKAPEIAINLFQLYEFVRQQVIKGFTKKDAIVVIQASEIVTEVLSGWKDMSSQEGYSKL